MIRASTHASAWCPAACPVRRSVVFLATYTSTGIEGVAVDRRKVSAEPHDLDHDPAGPVNVAGTVPAMAV